MASLDDSCASCTYFTDSGYCERKGRNAKGSDYKCDSYCEAYSRSRSEKENLYEKDGSSSGCYLTTMICKWLGYNDDNYYLNTLRKFRDNNMKTNKEYRPLLVIYDVVGPVISDSLANDPNGKNVSLAFFNTYITKAVGAIEAEKEKMAIDIYRAMTEDLADHYGIDMHSLYINADASKTEDKYLGHGRTRVLAPSTK